MNRIAWFSPKILGGDIIVCKMDMDMLIRVDL